MAKKIKMVLYGEPGTGKSVFALKSPKPFFITTDGNYEWLEDFGAKEEDHVQVSSWAEAKKAFTRDFSNYETIVVDLTEDLFKWCEYEYCIKNKLEHVSDSGYGKGYDTTRNEFFIEICKLIGLDKHIILIMHGLSYVTKDRRGVEHTKHGPTNRIPDKVLDMIEGRVRYFLRCYLAVEEGEGGTLIKKRYLSIVPKENEFGICRGIDENKIPHDIPLEFDEFAKVIGLYSDSSKPLTTSQERKVEIQKAEKEADVKVEETSTVEKTPVVEEIKKETVVEKTPVEDDKAPFDVDDTVTAETVSETSEPKTETEAPKKELSNDEKLAAIKAKLAAIKNAK